MIAGMEVIPERSEVIARRKIVSSQIGFKGTVTSAQVSTSWHCRDVLRTCSALLISDRIPKDKSNTPLFKCCHNVTNLLWTREIGGCHCPHFCGIPKS
jgi:hypothetical protein